MRELPKMSSEERKKWIAAAVKLPPNISRLVAYVKNNFDELNWADMVYWSHERILAYVKEFSESRYRKMMRYWREKGVDMNEPGFNGSWEDFISGARQQQRSSALALQSNDALPTGEERGHDKSVSRTVVARQGKQTGGFYERSAN